MAIPPGGDAETSAGVDGTPKTAADAELVRATVRDLHTAAAQEAVEAETAAVAEERLVRLETQTQALTEVVIAVRNTTADVVAAVQAVEEKLADNARRSG